MGNMILNTRRRSFLQSNDFAFFFLRDRNLLGRGGEEKNPAGGRYLIENFTGSQWPFPHLFRV